MNKALRSSFQRERRKPGENVGSGKDRTRVFREEGVIRRVCR